MNPLTINYSQKYLPRKWDSCKNIANLICSRESTYRTALDVVSFDIPACLADIFRGPKRFLETLFETTVGALMIYSSPLITTGVGTLLGKVVLSKENQKDTMKYLNFSMEELRDFEKFKLAAKRVKDSEVEDKLFLSNLYKELNHGAKSQSYKKEAEITKEFYENFTPSKEIMSQVYKLKKMAIVGQSLFEGIWWGGTGLFVRAFRKYVLREDRFTGTMQYLNQSESKQLNEDEKLSKFQWLTGITAMLISPIMNYFTLTKLEKPSKGKQSKLLEIAKSQLDTTHGVFPKLGMLFTVTIIPKYFSVLTTSQGWSERIERLLKLVSVVPSWWLGHRVTNGTLAFSADKYLAKKYNINSGILIEKSINECGTSIFKKIENMFPEPAKINHVLDVTRGNAELHREAENMHAKCLFKGFAMHSVLVWLAIMSVNYLTKIRALKMVNG